jgi:hypothetical protein
MDYKKIKKWLAQMVSLGKLAHFPKRERESVDSVR